MIIPSLEKWMFLQLTWLLQSKVEAIPNYMLIQYMMQTKKETMIILANINETFQRSLDN